MRHILTFRVVLIFSLILQAGFLTAEGEAESAVTLKNVPDKKIPLKKVTLFSSGVGYFERNGYIEGNSSMELTFDVSQINDILKSMVVRDYNGGTIDRIDYSPQEPLSRVLKSFIIDLSGNPGLPGILNQARGESVRITTSGPLTGKIIGVEKSTEYTDNGENTEYSLNLLTADGIVSIDLKEIKDILFLNPVLKEDLKKSLSLIARENSRTKKRVVLHFNGTGKRRISIGYLTGMPVWKTSYRIVLGEGDKHFLQGWAIVENTTDEDWDNVKLSLVSGQPISFTMDLYKPVYIRRQHVKPDLQRQVESQVYEDNLEYPSAESTGEKAKKSIPMRAPAMKKAGSRYLSSSESAAEYRDEGLRMNLSQGVHASARGRSAGEFFEYSVKMPVTIKRQQSAMIPIINADIRGGRVSIYNEKVDPVNPLNGIKLKNTTGMYLTAGPVTVFEKGIYAGDSRIKTLAPGAERLISYSIDLDTEVKAERTSAPDTLISVKIVHGTLISKSRRINEITYIIKNSGKRKKNVLIEQPVRAGWKLVEPLKPYEKTRNYYRFMVLTGAGAGGEKSGFKKLKVVEEKILSRSVILSNIDDKLIGIYIKSGSISAGVKGALKEISNRMNELTLINDEVNRLKKNYKQIWDDQTRIRKNMARLSKNSGLYKRYVEKLNKQEDEITALLGKMDGLQVKWEKQRAGLNAYISSLDL